MFNLRAWLVVNLEDKIIQMTILITGATGLIGKKMVSLFKNDNHIIHYLTTSKSKIQSFKKYWNSRRFV